ncbi:hypothetical protein [Janthinobacterium lividum]|uniref:Transcription factor zinc-finger domain-containing protein n=1 Tax=Janthinobacterium lividum TaxID=29581 RepID=A0ABU0Y192_9BURK|nr:hypothetical protein [Janthinobacterium lividum]MDQ4628446.1 hypothetical protein [Janthinobacterium lividum]MDQ4676139.1 hypothetical protein [Janthinobacterium lividum]MDQ4687405.1 hypothetical protein [Janthinobacterium lividum]
MECPTCGEYGDLLHATVKKTGQAVIVCTECDFVWLHPVQDIDPAHATDVASLLAQAGLDDDWAELELGARVPPPATA